MEPKTIVNSLFLFIAGIGCFLVALSFVSKNLEILASDKIKKLFQKTSDNKIVGVGIGTLTTGLIQSSGATTVMTIGFVNAGIMTLAQAATVVFGANIGTTITGLIISLGQLDKYFSLGIVFASLAGFGGSINLFAKKQKIKNIAGFITGLGLLFLGLWVMSDAVGKFTAGEKFRLFLSRIDNFALLILIGTLITALAQSSSLITGILIVLLGTGLININQAIYLILGSNIGSCVVAIVAGFTSTTDAKRIAVIHLMFNIFGTVIFVLVDQIMFAASHHMYSIPGAFGKIGKNAGIQIAIFHAVFNIVTMLMALPLTSVFVKFAQKLLPEKPKKDDPDQPRFVYIEPHFLSTPPIAVAQTKNEILNMASISMRNFNLAIETICKLDFQCVDSFNRNEKQINFLYKGIHLFLAKVSDRPLTNTDHIFVSSSFKTISDIERIGDYAKNIIEYAQVLESKKLYFSDTAVHEILELQELVKQLYDKTMLAFVKIDENALTAAYEIEDQVDAYTEELSNNHIERLEKHQCTAEIGAQFLSLVANVERIADHLINIANTIKNYRKNKRNGTGDSK